MSKLQDLKGKFVVLCDQTNDTEVQHLAFVKDVAEDKVLITYDKGEYDDGEIVLTHWKALEDEYASENWITLENFFEYAEPVGKKIILKNMDSLEGDILCLYKYKDLNLVAQIEPFNISMDVISDNVYQNDISSNDETIYEVLMANFEGIDSNRQIVEWADLMQDKEMLLKRLIVHNDYLCRESRTKESNENE